MQRIEDFFSKDVTHFITLHDVDDKENKEKERKGPLGSPFKLKGRCVLDSVMVVSSAHRWLKGRTSSTESTCL